MGGQTYAGISPTAAPLQREEMLGGNFLRFICLLWWIAAQLERREDHLDPVIGQRQEYVKALATVIVGDRQGGRSESSIQRSSWALNKRLVAFWRRHKEISMQMSWEFTIFQ